MLIKVNTDSHVVYVRYVSQLATIVKAFATYVEIFLNTHYLFL